MAKEDFVSAEKITRYHKLILQNPICRFREAAPTDPYTFQKEIEI
jgi:hypothetical protein